MNEFTASPHPLARNAGRTLRCGLVVLACGLVSGCDPNPKGPAAVPPAASPSSEAPPKAKPDNPLIMRD